MKGVFVILAVAGILGTAANAVSPRGISWTRPLGRGVGPRVAEAGLVPIDLPTVKSLLANPRVAFVDARSPEDFAIGRLPGAIRWNPAAALPPRERRIVVYCSNEFCDQALQAGEELKKAGYRDVAVFVEGYEAWWNAGGPVDQD